MARTDWSISGPDGQAIIEDGGSKRCRLSGSKMMLWNGNSSLANSEIVVNIQMQNTSNTRGGLILRGDASGTNFYRLFITGYRTYTVQKSVDGNVTALTTAISTRPWNEYTKTRFRVDGYQLSVEEYYNESWNLVVSVIDTESSLGSGYAGLFGASVNSSFYITFDNVEISQRI